MRNALLIFLLICCFFKALSQNAVRKSFEFLQVSTSARLSGLGGVNVSLNDRDINLVQFNPALAGDTLAGLASVNYQFYVAGIGSSSLVYAHDFKRAGVIAFGVQHLSYGTITSYDQSGAEIGEFKAAETAITISKAHQISNFRIATSLKLAFSNLAGYRASAILFDIGGLFVHPSKRLTVGLSVRNLGLMLSDYSSTSDTQLPFDVQVGTTFKPEHMPLRFSITAYRLTAPAASYDSLMGFPEPSTLDQVFRHLNFAAEILVHRNVDLLVGYNVGIHQELRLAETGGSAGLTFGFSVRVRAFELTFSRSAYVPGQAGYTFSLSQDINKLLRRR